MASSLPVYLFERSIHQAAVGIVLADMRQPDQPIVYANPAFLDLCGYGLDEVIGRNCRFLQGEARDQEEVARLRDAVDRGEQCTVLLRNVRRDGKRFWNELTVAPVRDVDGSITHYVGFQQDVTQRVELIAAHQRERERLDAVFALSPDGFVGFGADGAVSFVNPAFERITGLAASALRALPRAAFVERLQHQCQRQAPFALPSVGEGPTTIEIAQPAHRFVQVRVRVGGFEHVAEVLYFRDITHEFQVDRLKNEFLSTAAHELRTPTASILGFAELLLSRQYPDERRRDMLQTIHRQADRLTQLVSDLLDLSRIEARGQEDLACEALPLGPLVREVVRGAYFGGDERRLALELGTDLPAVVVDRERFTQALTHLLSNALKYSPGDTRVQVSVSRRCRDGRDEVGVVVTDRGIGMTPEQAGRAFERFFRADGSGHVPGTGLGMSIVHEIQKLHGGSAEIESVLGRGTTVTLWYPLAGAALRLVGSSQPAA